MTRTRLLLPSSVIVLLALVAGCSGDDDTTSASSDPSVISTSSPTSITDESVATTRPSPSSIAPTPTSAATTPTAVLTTPASGSQAPPGPPSSMPFPVDANGQPDWVLILQELQHTATALLAAPDPARATEFCAGGSPCYDLLNDQLENMVADDAHVEGVHADRIVSVEISESQAGRDPLETGLVMLTALAEKGALEPGARLADSQGNTLYVIEREATAGEIITVRYFLGQDANQEWRIIDSSSSEEGS